MQCKIDYSEAHTIQIKQHKEKCNIHLGLHRNHKIANDEKENLEFALTN